MTITMLEQIRCIQVELDSIRLDAICKAGLCMIYRELYETALNRVGDREMHDVLRDLLASLDFCAPFGDQEEDWLHKCEELGIDLCPR